MLRRSSSCRWRLRPERLASRARWHTRRCAAPPAGQLPSSVRDSQPTARPRAAFSRLARPHAAVYEYWLEKRKRLGKPALRRLQPPPAVTDPNPFNVFRPREKLHRHARELQLQWGVAALLTFAAAPTGRKRAGAARTTAQLSNACAAFDTIWTPRAPSWSGYSGGNAASVTSSSAKSTCSC